MKSRLKHGKLVAPESLKDAVDRIPQLRDEIESIKAQIRDPSKPARFSAVATYDKWKISASQALAVFRSEERQILEWLRARLLEDLYKLFPRDIDHTEDEALVLKRAEAFFEIENKKSATG